MFFTIFFLIYFKSFTLNLDSVYSAHEVGLNVLSLVFHNINMLRYNSGTWILG